MSAYKLPDLPYDYNELEPVISARIMELHHKKHHNTYVTKLNKALEEYANAQNKNDVATMIKIQSDIKFNGGGHVNHSIFWTILSSPQKKGGGEPEGDLGHAIHESFGSFTEFVDRFNAHAAAIQGSGWAWLGYCHEKQALEIATCQNQDPLSTKGLIPIMGVDMWEHAYYLQYENAKADYLKNIWQVMNWSAIAERYARAR